MEDWLMSCRYLLMPTRQPVKGFEKEYHLSYQTWRLAWEKYRRECEISAPLKSDGFMIPDEMGVLFYQDRCVGLSSFGHGSLRQGPMQDLSWFGSWDELSCQRLLNVSSNAMICSQFTVHPDFAGKGQITRWKDIISLYSLMRFYHSDKEVMAGSLNTIRGMQNAGGEDAGAIVLNPHHTFNFGGKDLPVQLVAYTKETIEEMLNRKNLMELTEALWGQLIHLSEFTATQNNIIPFKKVS